MRNASIVVLLVSIIAPCASVSAQVVAPVAGRRWYSNPVGYGAGAGFGGGYGLGYGNYGGGTAEGNYLQGMSQVIRAEGQANLNNSEARINNEQARSAYIDNRVKWTNAYYEQKSVYQSHQDEKNQKEIRDRDQWLAKRESGFPPRLNQTQLDPVTGFINWPLALSGDDYTAQRKKAEELLLVRKYTGPSEALAKDLKIAANSMHTELRTHINEMDPNEYIAARKFLDSLSFEGRYAVQ